MRNGTSAARRSDEAQSDRHRRAQDGSDHTPGSAGAATPAPAGPAPNQPGAFEPNWAMLVEFPEDRIRMRRAQDTLGENRHTEPDASVATGASGEPAAVGTRDRPPGNRSPVLLALLLIGTTVAAGSYLLPNQEPAGVPPPADVPDPQHGAGPAGAEIVAPRNPEIPVRPPGPGPDERSVAAVPPASQAAPEPVAADAAPAGPSRDMVATAQRGLSEAGFAPGPIDGAMGAQTRQAVRSFQRHIGVSADGVIDATMLRRLDGYRHSRATSPAPPAVEPAAAPAPEVDRSAGLPPYGDTITGRTIVVWGGKTVLGIYEPPAARPLDDPGSGGPGAAGNGGGNRR